MGIENTVKITPENSASLKNILGDDEDSKEDFEYIKSCVEMIIGSKFEERRNLALLKLQNYFNRYTTVHQVIDEDKISVSVYISPTKDKDAFLFIARYENTLPDTSKEPELINREKLLGRKLHYN